MSGKYTSALGLLRLQYEALVRSLWVYFCATDDKVERLANGDPSTNEQLPQLAQMLESLERQAPRSLAMSLLEFRESSWKPLSSYVHSGIHALRWIDSGFPGPLLTQNIKVCDGMLVFTALHFGELSGNLANGMIVIDCAAHHTACVPPLRVDESAV